MANLFKTTLQKIRPAKIVDEEDPSMIAAREERQRRERQRGGRQSTILDPRTGVKERRTTGGA